MSARAACRLIGLGFRDVYDYAAGKVDWMAANLPVVGDAPEEKLVAHAMTTDHPTCDIDERLGDVRMRTLDEGWDVSIVLDCDGVVVGRLRTRFWEAPYESRVGDVMENGPGTVRPDAQLEPLVERMKKRDVPVVVVTTAQGELLGVLRLDDAERVLDTAWEKVWVDCDGCPGQWSRIPA